MGDVSSSTFYHPTSCVEVHPEEEPQEGPLQVVADVRVVEDLQQFWDFKYGLADGFNKPVLSLK